MRVLIFARMEGIADKKRWRVCGWEIRDERRLTVVKKWLGKLGQYLGLEERARE